MKRKRIAGMRRFASSAVIAFPITVVLLFLMTRLILPGGQDRIVTRMIQNIEYQRDVRPPDPSGIQIFELPPPVEDEPIPVEHDLTVGGSTLSPVPDTSSDDSPVEDSRAHVIDWWAEARKVTQQADEDALKRWLLEQGYDRYVSIMQGPLPITNSVRASMPPTQEDTTGYLNTYGDMELKISDNCVLQTQVSARLDISDFARKLPMRVVCKSAPKVKFPFDRSVRE